MSFEPERLAQEPLIIGALGSLVALKFVPGATWFERAGNVASGAVTACYGTPALSEWMSFSKASANLSAFVIGLISMSLTAAILQGVKNIDFADIAKSWLKRGG